VTELPDEFADRLPAGYLAALEAFAAGEPDDVVAERIGVDPAAANAALRLATAKLLAATATDQEAAASRPRRPRRPAPDR
jgi:hypothetical protein